MTTDEIAKLIPPEVVEALKKSIKEAPITGWAEAAIAAALNAWEGMENRKRVRFIDGTERAAHLFLPLPQEASDE